MWLNFNTKKYGDYECIHPSLYRFTLQNDNTYNYNINMKPFLGKFTPMVYNIVDKDESNYVLKLFDGFNNVPIYYFDEDLYNSGEFPLLKLEGIDSATDQIESYSRREEITKRISSKIQIDTELKYLRLAIIDIISVFPELQKMENIEKFLNLSEQINTDIAMLSKENTLDKCRYEKEIDFSDEWKNLLK